MYSRELSGQWLTLSASGWVYDNTFVLYDYETESIWYHLEGTDGLTCIGGVYADKFLPEHPSQQIRWKTWRTQKPDSKFLIYP